MKTFLGTEVEQSGKTIKLNLDCYIQQVLAEYKAYIKKMLRVKKVPISPGVILNPVDVPELPDQRKQKCYRSFVANPSFKILRIGEVTDNRTCCLGAQIRIGAIALLDDQRPACSCCTTNRRSHGSPRCRRLRLSRLRRLNTTLHEPLSGGYGGFVSPHAMHTVSSGRETPMDMESKQ